MGHLVVGVDVGAMKIMAGVFDDSGRRLFVIRRSTKRERGADVVASRIVQCVEDVVDEVDLDLARVRAVGVGVPGQASEGPEGRVSSERLGWSEFPLGHRVGSALGVPTFVENDHRLATVGVYTHDTRSEPRRVVGIFLGTRIGAGMVVDGALDRSFEGDGRPLAHWVLDPEGPRCDCGRNGCFQAMASRAAVLQRIREGLERGRPSLVSEAIRSSGALRGKELRRAFRGGDSLVMEAMFSMAHWTGRGLAKVIEQHRPEVVILGGGMMEALGDDLLPMVVHSVLEATGEGSLEGVRVMTSSLGDEACLTGASEFARYMTKPGRDPSRAWSCWTDSIT